jgi:hypothetical protein
VASPLVAVQPALAETLDKAAVRKVFRVFRDAARGARDEVARLEAKLASAITTCGPASVRPGPFASYPGQHAFRRW